MKKMNVMKSAAILAVITGVVMGGSQVFAKNLPDQTKQTDIGIGFDDDDEETGGDGELKIWNAPKSFNFGDKNPVSSQGGKTYNLKPQTDEDGNPMKEFLVVEDMREMDDNQWSVSAMLSSLTDVDAPGTEPLGVTLEFYFNKEQRFLGDNEEDLQNNTMFGKLDKREYIEATTDDVSLLPGLTLTNLFVNEGSEATGKFATELKDITLTLTSPSSTHKGKKFAGTLNWYLDDTL